MATPEQEEEILAGLLALLHKLHAIRFGLDPNPPPPGPPPLPPRPSGRPPVKVPHCPECKVRIRTHRVDGDRFYMNHLLDDRRTYCKGSGWLVEDEDKEYP